MVKGFKKAFSAAIVLALIYALGGFYERSPASGYFSERLLDTLIRIRTSWHERQPPDSSPFVIVAADQESLDRINQRLPWSRKVWARLLDRLAMANPRSVHLDYFFTGASADASDDEAFRASFAAHRQIVIGALTDRGGHYAEPYAPFLREPNVRLGALNLPRGDGILRYFYSAVWAAGGQNEAVPSFSLAGALSYWNCADCRIQILPAERSGLLVRYPVRVGSGRESRIVYAATPGREQMIDFSFRLKRIPLWRVLEDDSVLPELSDKIVFVGDEALILKDLHPTPVGVRSGVLLHALGALTLIRERGVAHVLPLVPAVLFLLSTLAVVAGLSFMRRAAALFLTLILLLGFIVSTVLLFCLARIYLNISLPLVGILLSVAICILRGDFENYLKMRWFKRRASLDALTGLLNLPAFRENAAQMIFRLRDSQDLAALVMCDIDHFKQINDSRGHEAGNRAILLFAEVLRKAVRRHDIVGRFGGDEFCILICLRDQSETALFIERLNRHLAAALQLQPEVPSFQISAGAAFQRAGTEYELESFFKAADTALYEAKNAGRGGFRIVELK